MVVIFTGPVTGRRFWVTGSYFLTSVVIGQWSQFLVITSPMSLECIFLSQFYCLLPGIFSSGGISAGVLLLVRLPPTPAAQLFWEFPSLLCCLFCLFHVLKFSWISYLSPYLPFLFFKNVTFSNSIL